MLETKGLHHITAIASDPQRNLEFYVGVLGLRLVKKTVNFDDPSTYHFYFGDELGRPGTILTFFPWPRSRRGVEGSGSGLGVAFAVPTGALGAWAARLKAVGVEVFQRGNDEGQEYLSVRDPDGMRIDLVECPRAAGRECWAPPGVDAGIALRGLYAVTMGTSEIEETVTFLRELLGLTPVIERADRVMLASSGLVPGRYVNVVRTGDHEGTVGAGSVHHVAFRATDGAELLRWRDHFERARHAVSPVMDRTYFKSIYLRSPSGLLFELATDEPGFAIDEPAERLGETLRLPSQFEVRRADIESRVPPVDPPRGAISV